jgi:hypothetical protein
MIKTMFKFLDKLKNKKIIDNKLFSLQTGSLLSSFERNLSFDQKKILSNEIQEEIKKQFNIDLEYSRQNHQSNLFNDLRNNGILQIKNYFNSKEITKIYLELENKWSPGHVFDVNNKKKSYTLNQINKLNLRYAHQHPKTFLNNENIQKILLDKTIIQICENYFGFVPTLYSLNLAYTSVPEKKIENSSIANYHRDPDDKFFLTFFVPLLVNKEDEAHYYICKTHNYEEITEYIKKNHLFKNISHKKNFYLNTYLWDNNRNSNNLELEENFKDLKKTIFMDVGDLLIEDGSGLHSGPKINKYERIMLWIRYGSPHHYLASENKFKYKKILSAKESFILRNFYI